jgi:hypothetical protein
VVISPSRTHAGRVRERFNVQTRLSSSRERVLSSRGSPIEWLLALVPSFIYFVVSSGRIGRFVYNLDEGVNTVLATRLLRGEIPLQDFFYHQPPLYLYVLRELLRWGGDPVYVARLGSIVATAATGVLIYVTARRFTGRYGSFLALCTFYLCPLQFFNLAAMPNAWMLLFGMLGAYLVLFDGRTVSVVAGATALILAMALKPLALSTSLAIGVLILTVPHWRRRRRAFVLASVCASVLAWLGFELLTHGRISELFALQWQARSETFWQRLIDGYPILREIAEQRGATGLLTWNLSEHRNAFLWGSVAGTSLPLLAGALLGGFVLFNRARRVAVALVVWLAFELFFNVVVWGPVWEHYFVLYIPALALLCAGIGEEIEQRLPGPIVGRMAAVVAVAVALGYLCHLPHRQAASSPALSVRYADIGRRLGPADSGLLTFDPFLNVVSGTRVACGVEDPLNVFGDAGMLAMVEDNPLTRFRVSVEDVVECLREDESIRVVLGPWSEWFIQGGLKRYVEELPESRVVRLEEVLRSVAGQLQFERSTRRREHAAGGDGSGLT